MKSRAIIRQKVSVKYWQPINAGLIADSFGDTPFSQAALPELANGQPQFLTPELDKQEAIYTAIMEYLDAAITDLPKGDKSDEIGEYDFIYKGDGEAWLKLAYGLKARYTMRLLARSSSKECRFAKNSGICRQIIYIY